MQKGEIPRKERSKGSVESDEEKRIRRHPAFGGDNHSEKGIVSIDPDGRYHVMRHESGPSNPIRRVRNNKVTAHQSEGELELIDMDN